MADIMTALSTLFTNVMTMLGTVVTTVVGNPLLLLFAILSLVGIAVGFYHRLVRG